MIIRLGFLAIAALFVASLGSQSHERQSSTVHMPSCEDSCQSSLGFCHWRLAIYLLRGYETELPQCIRAQLNDFRNLEAGPRILLGIQELDAALASPAGITQSMNDLLIEKGDAYIDLAHSYIATGDFRAASDSHKKSVQVYLTVKLEQVGSTQRDEVICRIASGMIRAGDALDAMGYLRNLYPTSPDRLYLTAESLFALQDHADAANYYELWIKDGCKSRPYMLTNDEYGEKWSLLLSRQPANQTKCEQLPEELRLRLQTLRVKFGHPNNLPVNSYPAIVFPESPH
jgi:hypothetical protein